MENKITYQADSLSYTKKLAEVLSHSIDKSGVLICLYGDIGSGKTTFTKFLAEYLGIDRRVTSPSFVILNEYHTDEISLYHFDLYRLEREGVDTILDELSEYTEKENSVTLIEWAEFSSGNLPAERLDIEIRYVDDEKREFLITAYGNKNQKILEKLNTHLHCVQ